MTFGTAVANADQMTVFTCHDPAGDAVGNDGWVNVRSGDYDMISADTCGQQGSGAMVLELAANAAGYQNLAHTEWVFYTPSWASIASYTIQVVSSYGLPGTGVSGSGQAFIDASDERDPVYDYRNLGAGAVGVGSVSRGVPDPVSSISVNASCDGQEGPCAPGVQVSHIDFSSAAVVLNDSTMPAVSDLTGSLVSGATLRGTADVDFNASDAGPGVYSGQLIVDGRSEPAVILNSNNGWCQNLGQTSDGTRSFAHPEPCAQTTSGSLTLDTAGLPDGQHALKLVVDDASGNATTAYDGTITTDNAPANISTPTMLAPSPVSVGSTLAAGPGTWSAPIGAGSISYSYGWEDCDAQGNDCQPIPGMDASSYTATAADSGHTVRAAITATDSDGSTSATSASSTLVASGPPIEPGVLPSAMGGLPNRTGASEGAELHLAGHAAISRSFARRAFTISGQLLNATGTGIGGATLDLLQQVQGSGSRQVIAHATTAPNGTFTVHVPDGPSRTITVAYRAVSGELAYATQVGIQEAVSAAVQMHITPRRTGSTGTITLAGRVSGPVPRDGVIVELLVHYRGTWEPLRTPRTDSSGRFHAVYEFQGAVGRFPFRAEVFGGQAGFPYTTGDSAPVDVSTG
ncbi:MAG: hypothetical protein ACLQMH_13600 [Solirubrobacteraceae bacterium]